MLYCQDNPIAREKLPSSNVYFLRVSLRQKERQARRKQSKNENSVRSTAIECNAVSANKPAQMQRNHINSSPLTSSEETMLQAAMARKSDANEMSAPPAYKSKGLHASKNPLKLMKEKKKRQRRISSSAPELTDHSPSPRNRRSSSGGKTTVLGNVKYKHSSKCLDFGMASLSERQKNAFLNSGESDTFDSQHSPADVFCSEEAGAGDEGPTSSNNGGKALAPVNAKSWLGNKRSEINSNKTQNGKSGKRSDGEEEDVDHMLNDVLIALMDLPRSKSKKKLATSQHSDRNSEKLANPSSQTREKGAILT